MIVDLSEADSKEELVIRLTDKNCDENEWFESYSDVLNAIENKLNNKNWTQQFALCVKENVRIIGDLNDFITVFDYGRNGNGTKIVRLSLQVESLIGSHFVFVMEFAVPYFCDFFWRDFFDVVFSQTKKTKQNKMQ